MYGSYLRVNNLWYLFMCFIKHINETINNINKHNNEYNYNTKKYYIVCMYLWHGGDGHREKPLHNDNDDNNTNHIHSNNTNNINTNTNTNIINNNNDNDNNGNINDNNNGNNGNDDEWWRRPSRKAPA